MDKILDVPVPLYLLKKYKIAFQIPGDKAQKLCFDDGYTESDITYCFLGGLLAVKVLFNLIILLR